jgi:hypothetical protein
MSHPIFAGWGFGALFGLRTFPSLIEAHQFHIIRALQFLLLVLPFRELRGQSD